jgi:REP element-mobilizing transposase RayT
MGKDYIQFQDRSFPLAYFLSFRGYGTWLHGDERMSMDRKNFQSYGSAKIPVNASLEKRELSNLKNEPFVFDSLKRETIKAAIQEVCEHRNYHLIALNVRTNHVHCGGGNAKPELIMNAFKAYATRRLREKLQIPKDIKIWSRHGSTRYLWTEEQIEAAVDYVANGQGDNLPDFSCQ